MRTRSYLISTCGKNSKVSITMEEMLRQARKNVTNFVFDVDGTLTDETSRVLPQNIEALQKIHEAGYPITLATGRTLHGARNILDRIGVPGWVVACTGAVVWDGEKIVTVHALPVEEYRLAIEFAKKYGMAIFASSAEGYYEQSFGTYIDPDIILNANEGVAPVGVDLESLDPNTISKLSFAGDLETVNNTESEWSALFEGAVRGHELFIDVVAPDVTKWRGIADMLEARGLHADGVVGAGDTDNDISWLKNVGAGFAMPHAQPGVIDASRGVLPDVEAPVAWLVSQILDS